MAFQSYAELVAARNAAIAEFTTTSKLAGNLGNLESLPPLHWIVQPEPIGVAPATPESMLRGRLVMGNLQLVVDLIEVAQQGAQKRQVFVADELGKDFAIAAGLPVPKEVSFGPDLARMVGTVQTFLYQGREYAIVITPLPAV